MRSQKTSEYAKLQQQNPNIKTNPTGSSEMIYGKDQIKRKKTKKIMIKSNT